MAHAFKRTKPLGLLALVLAIAFGASAAQAETAAHWNTNKNPFDGSQTRAVKATTIEGGFGTFLSKSVSTTVEILCTTMKAVDFLLKEHGGASGKVHFEGCITKLNKGSALGACKPHSPGAALGLIETNALDALIVLHSNKTVDLVEMLPTAAGPFVTLLLGVDEECSIGEKWDVTGKFFLKDNSEELLKEKQFHLFVEGPLSALLFGGNAAAIDGSVSVELQEGLDWSGIAG